MKRIDLFKTLRKHRKLAEKRALNFDQNRAAKCFVWIISSVVVIYLLFLAVLLSLAANDSVTTTPMEFTFGLLPFVLLVDFSIRYLAQEAPSQTIKPYLLLPIPKYACIDSLLISSVFTGGNFIWFFLLIPYSIMSLMFSYSLWMVAVFLILWWLLIVINNQWMMLCKTLITGSQLWWVLPVGGFALLFLPIIIALGKDSGWEQTFDLYANIGTMLEGRNPLPLVGAIAVLALLFEANRLLQYRNIWAELGKAKTTKLKTVSQLSFLDKFGDMGMYLKLEIKTIIRNKNPRKSFLTAIVTVIFFSLVISFTDVYDGDNFTTFWCLYNYVIFSSISLSNIMGSEGNYIDGLMIHKENLLSIFKAKYIFNALMLLLPMLLMLPPVLTGKWSFYMVVSYAVFTAGIQFFAFFQMAVYNKQTVPLNTKFISKANMNVNYVQLVVSFGAYLVPMGFFAILMRFCSPMVAYTVFLVIGLAFVCTSNIWLRNVYNRLMKRKYENMESFRASRL